MVGAGMNHIEAALELRVGGSGEGGDPWSLGVLQAGALSGLGLRLLTLGVVLHGGGMQVVVSDVGSTIRLYPCFHPVGL